MLSEPRENTKGFRRLPPDAELAPDLRAAIEAGRAERQSPEYEAGLARDIESYRTEFPPARDLGLMKALADLRRERIRQGLTLSDMAERTGIDLDTIGKLETGSLANPTVSAIRNYAAALGCELAWTLARHVHSQALSEPGGCPSP